MADLLLARAHFEHGVLSWSFVDEELRTHGILIEPPFPAEEIREGDVWHVELVSKQASAKKKSALVRLVSRERQLSDWHKIKELPNHYIDEATLEVILSWLHTNTNFVLIGEKGSGKTTLCYRLTEALGWEFPCKVDIGTIKHGNDLFGSESAEAGSTRFRASDFYAYIMRAQAAFDAGLSQQFLVILDEFNRVHEKNMQVQGLFDNTHQMTITTTSGSTRIIIPQNVHFIGTMNLGVEYGEGVFSVGEPTKDRFSAARISPMPFDYEVAKLARQEGILEAHAKRIVEVAGALRDKARAREIKYSPSYRACQSVARLVREGINFHRACVFGFLGWYEGELKVDHTGKITVPPGTEVFNALAALQMKNTGGNGSAREIIEAVLGS